MARLNRTTRNAVTGAAAAVLALVSTGAAWSAAVPNNGLLVNGGFEANPPPVLGNNHGRPIAPWVMSGAAAPNVVRVDGPGGFNYPAGPNSDASSAAGFRHYFDAAQGAGRIFQSFTARCSGPATIRGFFSSRRAAPNGPGVPGSGSLAVRNGAGVGGTLLGQAPVIGYASANAWSQRTVAANLTAGQVYSVVVVLDNNLHFDEAAVVYGSMCPAVADTGGGAPR